MKYIYKNITFNHTKDNAGEVSGAISDDYSMAILSIPSKHVIGMKRDGFYNIIEYNNKDYYMLSHLDEYDYENSEKTKLININSEISDTINTDLQIVYYKWAASKTKQIIIDVLSYNPYWLFHDICHADDVQGSEVCCLTSNLEERRLEQGIDLMIKSGYTPSFEEIELDFIYNSFFERWRTHLEYKGFYNYQEQFN